MQCCGGSPAGRMQKDLIQFYQLRKSWCWPFRYSRIRRPHALDFANLCATFGHQAWWEGVGAAKRFARQTGRQENAGRSAHHSRTKSIRVFELFPLPCLQAMFGSGQLRLWQHCSGLQTDRHGLAMVSYQCSDISLSPVRSAYVLSISIYETTTCNTYIYTSVNIIYQNRIEQNVILYDNIRYHDILLFYSIWQYIICIWYVYVCDFYVYVYVYVCVCVTTVWYWYLYLYMYLHMHVYTMFSYMTEHSAILHSHII